MFFNLKNPFATAPPVSPDVATRMVIFLFLILLEYDRQFAINLAPTSLKAKVGP